jgi:hypothetical protein
MQNNSVDLRDLASRPGTLAAACPVVSETPRGASLWCCAPPLAKEGGSTWRCCDRLRGFE